MFKRSRRLGAWESLHAGLHCEANGHGTITVVVRVDQQLKKADILASLKQLTKKHRLLSSVVSANLKKFIYKKDFLNSLPVSFKDNADIDDWYFAFDNEQNASLDLQKQLWRMSFLFFKDKTDILFSVSHVICDGAAVAEFFKDFFSHTKHDNFVQFPPAVEKALKIKGGSELPEPVLNWPYQETALYKQRASCSEMLFIDKDELEKIKSFCHDNAISLNAWLAANLLHSLNQLNEGESLPAQGDFFKAQFEKVDCFTLINLRRYAKKKKPLTGLGCYSSVITTEHTVGQELIELAGSYQKQLKQKMKKRDWLSPQLSKQKAKEVVNTFADGDRGHFLFPVGITNLGKVADLGDVDIDFVYGNTSRIIADFALFLAVIECSRGLCLTFSYTAPMLSPQDVKALSLAYKKQLCVGESTEFRHNAPHHEQSKIHYN